MNFSKKRGGWNKLVFNFKIIALNNIWRVLVCLDAIIRHFLTFLLAFITICVNNTVSIYINIIIVANVE